MPASEARPPLPSPATGPAKVVRPAPAPIISTNPADLGTPGAIVEVDAETAPRVGTFEETALSEAHAWDANADIAAEQPPRPSASPATSSGSAGSRPRSRRPRIVPSRRQPAWR